jgi:hypothetical protein
MRLGNLEKRSLFGFWLRIGCSFSSNALVKTTVRTMAFALLKKPFLPMASNLTHLKLLQIAIRLEHDCDAVHRQTVPVHETIGGKTIWKGEVEVFDLDGHATAKTCYAWWQDRKDTDRRYVTVLEKQIVNSAEMAVKAAVFFNAQPVPVGGHD